VISPVSCQRFTASDQLVPVSCFHTIRAEGVLTSSIGCWRASNRSIARFAGSAPLAPLTPTITG
jgi:hypothetical protein